MNWVDQISDGSNARSTTSSLETIEEAGLLSDDAVNVNKE